MGDITLLELSVALALVVAALLGVIALVDVVRRPAWQWSQAGKSRGLWVALLGIGIVAGTLGGLLLAIAYYFFVQPALARATHPIGPPGGSYRSRAV